MNTRLVVSAALAGCLGLVLATTACQEVEQPSPVLTDKQWDKVKRHIFDYAHDESAPDKKGAEQAPEPEYTIGANYQDKIKFIGFSVGDPDKNEPLTAGETVEIRWYWKALEDMDKNWKIFVHFDSKESNVDAAKRRQNLDHHPLDGLFPTSKWPKGKIIEDVQEVEIRADYPAGPAVPYVGFYRGQNRLKIKNDVPKTKDNRVKAPSLQVANSGAESAAGGGGDEKPSYRVATKSPDVAKNLEVDGRLDESIWSNAPTLSLSPFGAAPDKKTNIRAVRSGKFLLIGAHLEDEHVWSSLEDRDSDTWTEEVVEMFVDVDGDGSNYLELQVNPLGTVFDANFKKRLGTGEGSRRDQIDKAKSFNLEGLKKGVHVEGSVNDQAKSDEFWSVELKIPMTSIPGIDDAKNPGGPWAVNFYRFDRPGGKEGKRTLSYAWNTAPQGDFHQVDKFGTFTFGGENQTDGGNGDAKKKIPEPVREKLRENAKLPGARVPKLPVDNPNVKSEGSPGSESAGESGTGSEGSKAAGEGSEAAGSGSESGGSEGSEAAGSGSESEGSEGSKAGAGGGSESKEKSKE